MNSGAVRSDDGARLPVALHRMRLSSGICLVDRHARCYVLFLVLRFLQANIQQKQK